MSWRHQIEAVLCAVFLLATIVVVAVKTLVPGIAASQSKSDWTEDSISEVLLTNPSKITSRAKLPRATPYSSLEGSTTGDEGSLWDEGPAYDLSQ